MKKKLILTALLVFVCTFMHAQTIEQSRRAAAMLNHLTVQSQLILSEKNNRVMLEEVYDNFINNLKLDTVDSDTQDQINGLLDAIHNFKMIETDREHLQILFENDMARAIADAMPNPTYLLSTVVSRDPLKTIASVAMMGLSSWTNYNNAKNDAKLANLKVEWELDKAAENIIHSARANAFNYMLTTVRNYPGIQDADVLREKDVNRFVELQRMESLKQRRQLLIRRGIVI